MRVNLELAVSVSRCRDTGVFYRCWNRADEVRAGEDHVEANHSVRLESQWTIGAPRKSVLARSLVSRYDRCRFFPFSPALAIEE